MNAACLEYVLSDYPIASLPDGKLAQTVRKIHNDSGIYAVRLSVHSAIFSYTSELPAVVLLSIMSIAIASGIPHPRRFPSELHKRVLKPDIALAVRPAFAPQNRLYCLTFPSFHDCHVSKVHFLQVFLMKNLIGRKHGCVIQTSFFAARLFLRCIFYRSIATLPYGNLRRLQEKYMMGVEYMQSGYLPVAARIERRLVKMRTA